MSSKSNGLSQDFIGFEDGNDNPKTDELRVGYSCGISVLRHVRMIL